MRASRGQQADYNRLLDGFSAKTKAFQECVGYLTGLGFSENQAKNAVHVYRKGGLTQSTFRLTADERNRLLDQFNATRKAPKECVHYLMTQGCTYRQATSAVYKYRQEMGLIDR